MSINLLLTAVKNIFAKQNNILFGKFLKRIRHYQHNNMLIFQYYLWHNVLIRAKNICDEKLVNE